MGENEIAREEKKEAGRRIRCPEEREEGMNDSRAGQAARCPREREERVKVIG